MVEITEIKEQVEQTASPSIAQQVYQYSLTPYPAALQSALLLSTPLLTKQPVLTTTTSSSSSGSFLFKNATKTKIGPSPISSLLFGGALGLGSFILYDGDVESGSGFITAWSALYLIVNGKGTFSGLRYGKVWPLLLSGVSLTNAYIYGKRFFYTNESSFQS